MTNQVQEGSLPEEAIRKSVIAPQTTVTPNPGLSDVMALDPYNALFFASAKADGIQPWGVRPTVRDRQLRNMMLSEPYTLSAVATVIATNMGLTYKLSGPDAAVARTQDMLQSAQFGAGWEAWNSEIGWDYHGQDKGAVSELVRDEDDPRAPVIGINHLEITRCWHTGNPEIPVLYQDRLGKWHGLKYYNCIRLSEMPGPHELLYGLQYSAMTRILGITKILRNLFTLLEEKTGGRHTRTVYIVSGIKKGDIELAIRTAQAQADQEGLTRFMLPVVVPTLQPDAKPELTEIALASLPDDFSTNMDTYMKWFIAAIAMGLLRDFQDFAPLPGGGLGTSQQSQTLHMKSRGKGSAIWQRRISHAFNFNGVMPRNVQFSFDEQDQDEEAKKAEMMSNYATAFASLIQSGVLDGPAVRQLMVDAGLIPQELFDSIEERDLTGQGPFSDNQRLRDAIAIERRALQAAPAGAGGPTQMNDDAQSPSRNSNSGRTQSGERDMTIDVTDDRLVVEDELTEQAERSLKRLGDDMARRLRSTVHAGVDIPGDAA